MVVVGLMRVVRGELVVGASSRCVVVLVVSRSWDESSEGRRRLRRSGGSSIVPHGRSDLVDGRGCGGVHVVVRPDG